jgi:hypothetical protein
MNEDSERETKCQHVPRQNRWIAAPLRPSVKHKGHSQHYFLSQTTNRKALTDYSNNWSLSLFSLDMRFGLVSLDGDVTWEMSQPMARVLWLNQQQGVRKFNTVTTPHARSFYAFGSLRDESPRVLFVSLQDRMIKSESSQPLAILIDSGGEAVCSLFTNVAGDFDPRYLSSCANCMASVNVIKIHNLPNAHFLCGQCISIAVINAVHRAAAAVECPMPTCALCVGPDAILAAIEFESVRAMLGPRLDTIARIFITCEPPRQQGCEVCLDSFPYPSEIAMCDCSCSLWCYGCAFERLKKCITAENPELPSCLACKEVFSEHWIEEVLDRALRDKKIVAPGKAMLVRKCNELRLYLWCKSDSHMRRCPSCGLWISLPATLVASRTRVCCQRCNAQFCSNCDALPHHFSGECRELGEARLQWMAWRDHDRGVLLGEMARQDARYQAELEAYRGRAAKVKEVKSKMERWRELCQDEDEKARTCRLCPSCGRIVQKLSGCDSMKCGEDAHGGNKQGGCGASFNWASAAV